MLLIRCLVVSLLILQTLNSVSFAKENKRQLISASAYIKATRLVEVEPGRRLNLYCLGKGSPTIVFESGLTEPINNWGWVQPLVARTTHACSYDRAGVGFSDPISRPATSANIVDDLHRMLNAADIKPPYILVGHSTGGLSTRLFAHTYPDEVVGMVLVDPSDENQVPESRKLYPEETDEKWQADIEAFLQTQRDCMNQAKKGFILGSELAEKCEFDQYKQLSDAVQKATNNFQMKLPYWQAQVSELENFYYTSAEQLRRARRSFGELPLIVLTETRVAPKDVSKEKLMQWQSSYDLWKSFHIAQAKLSSRGVQKIVPDSGHQIPFDRPEVVENAILRILKMVAKGK